MSNQDRIDRPVFHVAHSSAGLTCGSANWMQNATMRRWTGTLLWYVHYLIQTCFGYIRSRYLTSIYILAIFVCISDTLFTSSNRSSSLRNVTCHTCSLQPSTLERRLGSESQTGSCPALVYDWHRPVHVLLWYTIGIDPVPVPGENVDDILRIPLHATAEELGVSRARRRRK